MQIYTWSEQVYIYTGCIYIFAHVQINFSYMQLRSHAQKYTQVQIIHSVCKSAHVNGASCTFQ